MLGAVAGDYAALEEHVYLDGEILLDEASFQFLLMKSFECELPQSVRSPLLISSDALFSSLGRDSSTLRFGKEGRACTSPLHVSIGVLY